MSNKKSEMSYNKEAAEAIGVAMAAQDRGIDPEGLTSTLSKVDALINEPSYRHNLFKVASVILEASDMETGAAYRFIEKASQANVACPEEYESMLKGAATFILQSLARLEDLEKSAANPVPALAVRLGAMTPSVVSTLAALSAAAGAGAGSVAWALNRHSRQDALDVEQMKAQIAKYNQVSQEIEERLRRKGYTTPEELEDISGAEDIDVDNL